ncbi:Type IV secretion system protein virB10 [compost metagenome]
MTLNNTSQSTQNLAAETLKNTTNIPPTGYANQGVLVNIYVARDVNMESRYELVPLEAPQ